MQLEIDALSKTAAAQSESVVSARGLVKRYGSHEAVAGIDLEVQRGEIFAFLGPNGAGKPNPGLRHFFQGLAWAIRAGNGGAPSMRFSTCGMPPSSTTATGTRALRVPRT